MNFSVPFVLIFLCVVLIYRGLVCSLPGLLGLIHGFLRERFRNTWTHAYFAIGEWTVLQMSVRSNWLIMLFKFRIYVNTMSS